MSSLSVDDLVDFAIALSVLSTIAIILRFWSRLVSPGVGCGWDDWLALAALPTALALTGTIIAGTHFGAGKHKDDIPDEDETVFSKLQLVGTLAFDFSISFSKMSALAFYSRVFRRRTITSRVWQWCYYITFGLTIAWLISMVAIALFRCVPLSKLWSPSTPGKCVTRSNTYLAGALSSVLIDIMILLLPLPLIFKLKIRLVRKLLIAGTFIIGYAAALMSVGRLISAAQIGVALLTNFIETSTPIMFWVIAEACLSIVAICLPAIFQLFNRGVNFGFGSLFASRDFTDLSSGNNSGAKSKPNLRFGWSRGSSKTGDLERDSGSGSSDLENTEKSGCHWTSEPVGEVAKVPMTSEGCTSVVTTSEPHDGPDSAIQIRRDVDVAVQK